MSENQNTNNELHFIVIEGVIGVGKTSLANKIRDRLDAKLILEQFDNNPFLEKFYSDRKRYAFQTQMFFLINRFKQQQELALWKKLQSSYDLLELQAFINRFPEGAITDLASARLDAAKRRQIAAVQSDISPAEEKADVMTSSVTCSGRAEESTIITFCPPVSAIRVLIGPLLSAKARLICWAVPVEPVNATPMTRPSDTTFAPIFEPRPMRRCNTSVGTPASCIKRMV